jgi:hypothetical protein
VIAVASDPDPDPTRIDRFRSAAQQGSESPYGEGPPRGDPDADRARLLPVADDASLLDAYSRTVVAGVVVVSARRTIEAR